MCLKSVFINRFRGLIGVSAGKSRLLPKDWKQPMGPDRKLSCLHFLRWRRGCIWSIIWTVRWFFRGGKYAGEITIGHLDQAPFAYYVFFLLDGRMLISLPSPFPSSQRVWAPAICWDVASHSWKERMLWRKRCTQTAKLHTKLHK